MKHTAFATLSAIAFSVFSAFPTVAEWPMSDRAREYLERFETTDVFVECIGGRSDPIAESRDLDSYRIVFETSRHNYYLNEIMGPKKCKGLGSNSDVDILGTVGPFKEFCEGDRVNVTRNGGLVGACKLGDFRLLKKRSISDLNEITASFVCGDETITVTFAGENATVVRGGETIALKQVVSASGAKYEKEGDSSTFFWNKGDGGMLSVDDAEFPECVKAAD